MRKLLKLWLVVVEGGMVTRIVCCAESQNTGSLPLLSDSLRFQACADAEIKTVPRHFARANQADRCINLLHCAQRSMP